MRAYSYVQFSVAIIALIVACVAGPLLYPQDAIAREPDYKMVCSSEGGTSGGGEWRTSDRGLEGELPVDPGRSPGTDGKEYSSPKAANTDRSWAEDVQAMIIRMVRSVGAKFSELF